MFGMERLTQVHTIVALIFASALAYASEGVSWDDRVYSQVEGKAEIPEPIRAHLRMDETGLHGVAEADQPFNETDVVTDRTLPFRRLLGAGRSGEYWLVIFDHGGYSRVFEAYVFRGSRLEKQWKHFWRPNQTFASITTSDKWWVPE